MKRTIWNHNLVWNFLKWNLNLQFPLIPFLFFFFFFIFFLSEFDLTKADFICDFEHNNTCGYESQPDLLNFTTISEFPTISGFGFMALDLSNVNLTVAPGARLMSKYYPTYKNDACLLIKFLCWGPGIDRWTLVMRNSHHDQRLYEYENDWNPTWPSNNLDQYWITMTVPIDLTSGQVMFFLTLHTKGYSPNGLFILDHIVFLYLKCPFKQSKHFPQTFGKNDASCANSNSNSKSEKE